MSAYKYFKELGHQRREPIFREISNAAVATTITLWTPTSGKRIAWTNGVIAAPIGGSISFYFQSANQLERKVLEVRGVATTSTIPLNIECIESTAVDCPLLVRVNTGATDAWSLTVEGFDID